MPPFIKHRRNSGLPADSANPAEIQPSNYADSHVFGGFAADRQAFLSKGANTDGWDADWLYHSDVFMAALNGTGGALAQGEVVAVSAVAGTLGLDDTPASLSLFAVCVEVALAPGVAGRFSTGPLIPSVKCKGSITTGHYVVKSATTKAIEDSGVALGTAVQPPSGALGVAMSGSAGDGFVAVLWFLRPSAKAPGIAAGYVKGTGTGFATQAIPIPAADLGTGTPDASKALHGDNVWRVPAGGGGGSAVIDRVVSPVTVTNTVTETALYSFNVTAALLAATKGLRLALKGTITDTTTGATATVTFRLKYGATTLATVVMATSVSETHSDGACPPNDVTTNRNIGTAAAVKLQGELDNLAAASQIAALIATMPEVIAGNANFPHFTAASSKIGQGAATEDSTADKTLTLTAQWSGASASRSLTIKKATLELL